MERKGLFGLLDQFFDQKFGRSIVIKGKPGAGKTTFGLEYMESVRKNTPVCYISARFSDEALETTFPWINEVSVKNLNGEFTGEIANVSTESLQKLERMIEEGKVTNNIESGLILNISDLLPEVRALYEFVDSHPGDGPLIVIDSIEALSEKYDINPLLLFSMIHSDLVERSGARLICILEAKENPKLEYFSDGVISMDYSIERDILVRRAIVEKLRGVSLGATPVFLYTLKGGRFIPLVQKQIIYPDKKLKPQKKVAREQFEVPLASDDLHKFTKTRKGSVPLGSVVMLHRNGNFNVVNDVVNLLKNNMIKDAILDGRGVIDATSSSYETSRILVNSLDPETMKHYITAEKSKRSNSFVINLEGKSIIEDFPNDVIDFFMSPSSRPDLYFFSTDFLMFTYGRDFFGDLVNLINSVRTTGAIVIVADDDYYEEISHYANLTIHVTEMNGYAVANSDPKIFYAATPEYDKEGWPSIEMQEMV